MIEPPLDEQIAPSQPPVSEIVADDLDDLYSPIFAEAVDPAALRQILGPLTAAAVPEAMRNSAMWPVAAKPAVWREVMRDRTTDLGNAVRLRIHFGARIRYAYPLRKWLVWDGRRWLMSERGEVEAMAKATVRHLFAEAAASTDPNERADLAKWAIKCQDASRIDAMIRLARSEETIPIAIDDLDRHPFALNVRNGTLDLETGALTKHDPTRLITKLAPVDYDPDATCPTWEAWLERMMGGDAETIRYLQQIAGLSLSGHHLQAFFVFYGNGANGKTTFLETLADMLGDYAVATKPETLMWRRGESNTDAELMVLRGARLVTAIEPQEGSRLNEGRIKSLVGGDTISARPLYADPIQFRPEFKLVLGTNHRPDIRGTDHGIWRRVKPIPWSVQIADGERNERYREDLLVPELPGILAWAVRGYQDWVANGRNLAEPSRVIEAGRTYRSEMDVLGLFLADECVEGGQMAVGSTDLYEVYKGWAERNGRNPVAHTRFSIQLQERGLERVREGSGRMAWHGVGLRAHQPLTAPASTSQPPEPADLDADNPFV